MDALLLFKSKSKVFFVDPVDKHERSRFDKGNNMSTMRDMLTVPLDPKHVEL